MVGNTKNSSPALESTTPSEQGSTSVPESNDTNTGNQNADANSKNKVLIAYFSYSGITKGVAERLQQKTGGDVFEIVPVELYPDTIQGASDRAAEERDSSNLPELVGEYPDLSGYDAVLIGGPVWTSTLPPPVMRYLADTDFGGKIVAPFWTYNSNEGQYDEDFRRQIQNASLKDGLGLSYVNRYEEADLNKELDGWLEAIGVNILNSVSDASETNITITIGNTVISAILNDSAAAQEFKAMLPTSISMTRMGEHEYYGSLEQALTHANDLQTGYTVGDLAFWTPGDLFALYFDEPDKDPQGLMILGRITTDLSVFDGMGSRETVRIEISD